MTSLIPPANAKLSPEEIAARRAQREAERLANTEAKLAKARAASVKAEEAIQLAKKRALQKRTKVRSNLVSRDEQVVAQLPPDERARHDEAQFAALNPLKQVRVDLARRGIRGSGNRALPNDDIGFSIFYDLMYFDRGMSLPPHLQIVTLGLLDRRIRNLLLIIGPGSGKSQLLSTAYPAFEIGQDPTNTILGISAGEALMQGFQAGVMQWIEFAPTWKQLFPGVTPNKDRGWSVDRGLFVRGHPPGDPDANYFACGLASKALTGKHSRIQLGDDLHDKENSASQEACFKVRDIYYNTLLGRADPRGCRYVYAGRRWHEEDIYGHLERSGEWVVMTLPALREKSKFAYWDVTVPEGLTCIFNEKKDSEAAEVASKLPVDVKTSTPKPVVARQI